MYEAPEKENKLLGEQLEVACVNIVANGKKNFKSRGILPSEQLLKSLEQLLPTSKAFLEHFQVIFRAGRVINMLEMGECLEESSMTKEKLSQQMAIIKAKNISDLYTSSFQICTVVYQSHLAGLTREYADALRSMADATNALWELHSQVCHGFFPIIDYFHKLFDKETGLCPRPADLHKYRAKYGKLSLHVQLGERLQKAKASGVLKACPGPEKYHAAATLLELYNDWKRLVDEQAPKSSNPRNGKKTKNDQSNSSMIGDAERSKFVADVVLPDGMAGLPVPFCFSLGSLGLDEGACAKLDSIIRERQLAVVRLLAEADDASVFPKDSLLLVLEPVERSILDITSNSVQHDLGHQGSIYHRVYRNIVSSAITRWLSGWAWTALVGVPQWDYNEAFDIQIGDTVDSILEKTLSANKEHFLALVSTLPDTPSPSSPASPAADAPKQTCPGPKMLDAIVHALEQKLLADTLLANSLFSCTHTAVLEDQYLAKIMKTLEDPLAVCCQAVYARLEALEQASAAAGPLPEAANEDKPKKKKGKGQKN